MEGTSTPARARWSEWSAAARTPAGSSGRRSAGRPDWPSLRRSGGSTAVAAVARPSSVSRPVSGSSRQRRLWSAQPERVEALAGHDERPCAPGRKRVAPPERRSTALRAVGPDHAGGHTMRRVEPALRLDDVADAEPEVGRHRGWQRDLDWARARRGPPAGLELGVRPELVDEAERDRALLRARTARTRRSRTSSRAHRRTSRRRARARVGRARSRRRPRTRRPRAGRSRPRRERARAGPAGCSPQPRRRRSGSQPRGTPRAGRRGMRQRSRAGRPQLSSGASSSGLRARAAKWYHAPTEGIRGSGFRLRDPRSDP